VVLGEIAGADLERGAPADVAGRDTDDELRGATTHVDHAKRSGGLVVKRARGPHECEAGLMLAGKNLDREPAGVLDLAHQHRAIARAADGGGRDAVDLSRAEVARQLELRLDD